MRFVHALAVFYFLAAPGGFALNPQPSAAAKGLVREIVMADVSEPSTPEQAAEFLSKILPMATAANPKYRSGASSELTQWLTKTVHFSASPKPPGIVISMSEEAAVFQGGAQTAVNSHQATFAIEDVHIIEYEYPADTTETGEKAVGVMFKCDAGNCIRSSWNGHESDKSEADLYVYDPTVRARILRAFGILREAARGKA
ncbi:MAG TPA: hypothetical protein VGH40_06275 [Roseiarcus sp.]